MLLAPQQPRGCNGNSLPLFSCKKWCGVVLDRSTSAEHNYRDAPLATTVRPAPPPPVDCGIAGKPGQPATLWKSRHLGAVSCLMDLGFLPAGIQPQHMQHQGTRGLQGAKVNV